MTPRTKHEALEKLAALSTGVGYPARWRDYSALVVKPDDLLGNWQRALKFDAQYRLGNVAGTAGGEWVLPPQTVNAYYSAATNEMVIPAAILQPPLFDVHADDAVNYGAAGALIGHEIGHAFDDRGRHFDGNGAVRDWWTAADADGFNQLAGRLIQQMNDYEPLPGLHVNGALAATESIGDLGGLTIAFRAYKLSLKGKRVARHRRPDRRAARLHGMGADLAVEGARRIRALDAADQRLPAGRRSAPTPPPSNIDGFYEAFNVKPGDRSVSRARGARQDLVTSCGRTFATASGRFATSRPSPPLPS